MSDPLELYREGQYERSLQVLRQLAGDSPSAANLLNQALCLKALSRVDEAFDCLEKSLALNPNQSLAWNELGLLWDDEGRLAKARECYQRALALDPGFAAAWNNLGVINYLTRNEKEAVACFQRALELDPQMESARANLEDLTTD